MRNLFNIFVSQLLFSSCVLCVDKACYEDFLRITKPNPEKSNEGRLALGMIPIVEDVDKEGKLFKMNIRFGDDGQMFDIVANCLDWKLFQNNDHYTRNSGRRNLND